mmetsp:Transcript_35937/g.56064  ORF Transcript_35937/g.56064 Transcript_35937/m.56064 type:complete len:90 (+) Transcript_35937:1126-1395(+)
MSGPGPGSLQGIVKAVFIVMGSEQGLQGLRVRYVWARVQVTASKPWFWETRPAAFTVCVRLGIEPEQCGLELLGSGCIWGGGLDVQIVD